MLKSLLGFVGLCFVAIPTAFATEPAVYPALKDAVVLIVRHGEKPDSGTGLSPQGMQRAKAYVEYFQNYKVQGQPLKIDRLFATKASESSDRPRLTIQPFADAVDLKIDTKYSDEEFPKLAKEIREQPGGKSILVAWHHGKIPGLLNEFGIDSKKLLGDAKWSPFVFCWVIQLRFDHEGKLEETKAINVSVLPCDINFPVPGSSKDE